MVSALVRQDYSLDYPPAPVERPHALLVMRDLEAEVTARAALHLVEVPVRRIDSFHEVFREATTEPPILVVFDEDVPDGIAIEKELLCSFVGRGIPVLRLARRDLRAETHGLPTLAKPFTPLQLLGAASRVQPALYDVAAAEPVETNEEEKLVLLTHDLRRATGTVATAIERVTEERRECDEALVHASLALVDILKLRDIETALHCYRVQAYARELAQVMAPELLDDETTELGFLLHDIGKLALPDRVLLKPGPLSLPERELMETHPTVGEEMAARLLPDGHGTTVIRSHHERWDGGGYPDGTKGTATPLEARIFAVADALDAITSDRPYRAAQPWAQALRVIAKEAGKQFDPAAVEALLGGSSALQRFHELRPFASDPSG